MAQQNMDMVEGVGREDAFRIAKFWCRSLHMKQEELLKCRYDWQMGNLRRKNWAAS